MASVLSLHRRGDPDTPPGGAARRATPTTPTSPRPATSATPDVAPDVVVIRLPDPSDDALPTFEQLYTAQRLAMVRLAILLVDDRASAEDVVQDAFAALHAHWHRLRDPHAAIGYLRMSVVNGARSMLRRRRTARAFVPPPEIPEPGADDLALLAEEHREVIAALAELAPRQREVIVLRYWSDLSEAQIAQTLGISQGTVKSTASRALDALEQRLTQKGGAR